MKHKESVKQPELKKYKERNHYGPAFDCVVKTNGNSIGIMFDRKLQHQGIVLHNVEELKVVKAAIDKFFRENGDG